MNNILAVLFDGVVYASWLFLMAAGLTLIYGVMKILNIAHGSLYALGAYTAATIAGAWLAAGHAAAGSYAMLALAALLVGAVMGPLLERGLLKWMYGRDEVVLLHHLRGLPHSRRHDQACLGGRIAAAARAVRASRQFSDRHPRVSRLQPSAGRSGNACGTGSPGRSIGRARRWLLAVIHDREISAAMGINVDRVYLVTFSVGAMLAGLGGALTAPTIAVSPGIGVEVIVLSFAVVVVGGWGALAGRRSGRSWSGSCARSRCAIGRRPSCSRSIS